MEISEGFDSTMIMCLLCRVEETGKKDFKVEISFKIMYLQQLREKQIRVFFQGQKVFWLLLQMWFRAEGSTWCMLSKVMV